MASLMDVFVPVRPDTDGFEPDLRRQLSRVDASKSGKQVAARFGVGFNGAIGSIAAKGAGIFAAGFAAVKGLQMFGGFITEAAESAKISRITENAIRATGGSAKITAAQVSDLATAISNKTAIDDEQIQQSANMLLTFKNIRNEAGKGNDVFNQAAMAAADLSVQFGGIDGASKQLGKALNDPIKGTTALAKAGVTFTDQQKDQIKTLVESGRTLEAQKIILAEIQSQVGGAATAAADPMSRLKVIAGNLGESIGGFLLPTVNRFANFISDEAIPGLTAFAAAFKANDGDITSSGFPGFMERLGFVARQAFDYFQTNVMPRLKEFAGFIREQVVPRLKEFGGYLRDTVIPIVVSIVTDHFAKLQRVFNDVRDAVKENKPELTQLFNGLQSVAKVVIEKVIPFLYQVGSVTLPVLGKAISSVITVTGGIVRAFNAIKEPIRSAISFVWEKVSGVFENILTGAAKAFGWVPNLGGKLETAAREFTDFRDDVNRSLDGIDDEAIKVALAYSAKGINLTAPSSVGRRASGGSIFGPGTATSDSVPILASNGEHMLSAREVIGAGGHRAVEAMRAQWRKMATGGAVLKTVLPSLGAINGIASGVARRAGLDLYGGMQRMGVNPGLNGVLSAVRSWVGSPYLWGGAGPGGFDCSGLVSAAINRAFGRYPYSRLGSTGTMPWGVMAPGPGAFMVGWFKGNPGHTAATVNGVNIESAGGVGVRMGRGARGAYDSLFTHRMHVKGFAGGGRIDRLGDLPYDLLKGRTDLLRELGILSFDQGGRWPSGRLGVNLSGKTETVLPGGTAGVAVTFSNCTFAGTSQKQFEDLVVGAVDKARGKRRI